MMKKVVLYILMYCFAVLLSSWGFYAHKRINETAIFLLPSDLAHFYKKNIKHIRDKAIDPDKRCYTDTLEPTRHYIDLDELDTNIDSIPIDWRSAIDKYTERKLLAKGVIPWQIFRTYQNLVQAFQAKDQQRIIRYSADIGHYIADAHVPLHTTSNYNGQRTNQIGIHAFWETRLPEMFSKNYNLIIGAAVYIQEPLERAWSIVKESNSKVDSVLTIEKELSISFTTSAIKSYIERNNQLQFTYSDEYALAYHNALQGMVERRFRSSIHSVASFWFSAWVDAGQPNLDKMDVSFDEDQSEKDEIKSTKSLGREEWHY